MKCKYMDVCMKSFTKLKRNLLKMHVTFFKIVHLLFVKCEHENFSYVENIVVIWIIFILVSIKIEHHKCLFRPVNNWSRILYAAFALKHENKRNIKSVCRLLDWRFYVNRAELWDGEIRFLLSKYLLEIAIYVAKPIQN